MIKIRIVCTPVVVILALAGCGGSSSKSSSGSTASSAAKPDGAAAYRREVAPIAAEFKSSVPPSKFKLQTAITPSSRAKALAELSGEFRRLADRLGALHPPSDAQAAQDAAVAAARTGAEDFKRAEGPARANDKKALKAIGAAMTRDGTIFQQKFSALGSKIGG